MTAPSNEPTSDTGTRALAAVWRQALALRGPTADGWPLSRWLTILAGVWLVCFAALGAEPALMSVPPVLTLAVALPLLQQGIRRLQRERDFRALQRWLEPPTVLLVASVLTYGVWGFVFRRGLPIDAYDHHIMIVRAELLANALAEGRMTYWSHAFQGGDSLVDLYPVLLNYLTAVVHFIRPGDPSFVSSYTWVCIAAWTLRGVGAYALARRFSGPLLSATMGLASLLEAGTEEQNGVWTASMLWGMIHNNIALSFGLFATAAQVDLCRKVTDTKVLLCSLMVAVTAVAHPLGMLYVAVSTAAIAMAAMVGRDRARRPLFAVAASACGLLMAAFWILPYTHALTNYGFNGSTPGIDYTTLGNGLFNARWPISSFAAYIGFCLVAIFSAVSARRTTVVAMGLLALMFVLLGIAPAMVQLRLYEYFPSFIDAQQQRMFTVLKTAIVPAGVILLALTFRHLKRPFSLAPRRVLARTLLLAMLFYVPTRALTRGTSSLIAHIQTLVPRPEPGPNGELENDTNDQLRETFDWIKQRREESADPTPWRMALWDRFDPRIRVHWSWIQGTRTGVPVVDFGWMSANFLGLRPRESTPVGLHDWNVRYVLGVSPKPPLSGLVERHRVGPYRVWELEAYNTQFIDAPAPIAISGLKVTDDVIRFDVQGAPAEGAWVTVRCAYFPRWAAAQAGKALLVKPVPPRADAKERQDQIGIRVKNGQVVLSTSAAYPRFHLGLLISCVAFGAALTLSRKRPRARGLRLLSTTHGLVIERIHQLRERARDLPRRVRQGAFAGAGVSALLMVWVLSNRGARVLTGVPIEGIGLSVATERDGERHSCSPRPLEGRFICGPDKSPIGVVEAALGQTPFRDDAGEYGKFWPGLSVQVSKPGHAFILEFSRAATDVGKLDLKYTASGAFEIWVESGLFTSEHYSLRGDQNLVSVLLPDGLSSPSTIAVHVLPKTSRSRIVLRGELR